MSHKEGACGVEKAKELNISEEEIELLIFAGR
jgi:hypothetical protein